MRHTSMAGCWHSQPTLARHSSVTITVQTWLHDTMSHPPCTGKLNRRLDGTGEPANTAARELEEESHWLLPAPVSKVLLPYCPRLYDVRCKMVIYMMRYSQAEAVPDLLQRRLQGEQGGKGQGGRDERCKRRRMYAGIHS